jgi:hypothetical protein
MPRFPPPHLDAAEIARRAKLEYLAIQAKLPNFMPLDELAN